MVAAAAAVKREQCLCNSARAITRMSPVSRGLCYAQFMQSQGGQQEGAEK